MTTHATNPHHRRRLLCRLDHYAAIAADPRDRRTFERIAALLRADAVPAWWASAMAAGIHLGGHTRCRVMRMLGTDL